MPPANRTATRPGDAPPVPKHSSLAAALDAAAKGYRVFPCRGKVPYYAKGKHPVWAPAEPQDEHGEPPPAGLTRATTDTETIRTHWPKGRDVTVGAVAPEGVVIYDVDVSKLEARPLVEREAEAQHRRDVLRDTFGIATWVRTPRKGYHGHAVRWPEGEPLPKMTHFPVGDADHWGELRGNGTSYVVLPGGPASRYQLEGDPLPYLATIPTAPPELVAFTVPPKASTNGHATHAEAATARTRPAAGDRSAKWAAAALEEEAATVRGLAEGGRRNALRDAAFRLGRIVGGGYLNADEVADELRAAVATQRPPLDAPEAERTIADSIRDGRKSPRHPADRPPPALASRGAAEALDPGPSDADAPAEVRARDVARSPQGTAATLAPKVDDHLTRYADTDAGNAERFVHYTHGNVRYAPGMGWLLWTGTHWARDPSELVLRFALDTIRATHATAALLGDGDKRRGDLIKHARQSEALGRLRAMLDLARVRPEVHVMPDQLDADPWSLNTLTGLVDLRTATQRPHDAAALCTMLAPAAFNLDADHPALHSLLDILDRDGRAEYIRDTAGQALTGHSAKAVHVWTGPSGTIKSTTADALMATLGPYGVSVEPSTLIVSDRPRRWWRGRGCGRRARRSARRRS